MLIRLGHTPDTDDAFMSWAMLEARIDCEGLEFKEHVEPISVLNERAVWGEYDMTAISAAFAPRAAAIYDVLPAGLIIAGHRGPILVRKPGAGLSRVAVPGMDTSSCVAARILFGPFTPVPVRFDRILPAVRDGQFDGGIIISEDQVLLAGTGLEAIDVGQEWMKRFGEALPLGVDVVRRSLPDAVRQAVGRVYARSIRYALDNPAQALKFAMQYARRASLEQIREFVHTYVSDISVDMGDAGRSALRSFLARATQAGLVPAAEIRFVA